jgi:Cu(I)/Ag(I) efflux system membrane fusion protein
MRRRERQPQPRPGASLKWPAMTMEFKAANAALLQALKPGAKVV